MEKMMVATTCMIGELMLPSRLKISPAPSSMATKKWGQLGKCRHLPQPIVLLTLKSHLRHYIIHRPLLRSPTTLNNGLRVGLGVG